MSERNTNIIAHIMRYCKELKKTISRFGDDHGIFTKDIDYQRSVCFDLAQIGELVKKLPTEFRSPYPQIPWKQICGLRDMVVHTYGTIDLNMIFEICHKDIDDLLKFCEQYLSESGTDPTNLFISTGEK